MAVKNSHDYKSMIALHKCDSRFAVNKATNKNESGHSVFVSAISPFGIFFAPQL